MSRAGGAIGTAIAVACVMLATGCVRSSQYQSVKRDLDQTRIQFETEKLRAQDLKAENLKLKQEIAELDAKFRNWREQLAKTEEEWKGTRDDLLRSRIDREQQRFGRDQAHPSRFRLLPEAAAPQTDASLQNEAQSPDMKRRLTDLKGVVQHIQTLLDQ